MGLLTPLGNDVATSWANLVAGRSGIRRIEAFDPSRVSSQIAGEVHDFDASGVLDRKDQRRTDRYIAFGLVAARQALDQAGLPARFEGDLAERTGVILGTGLGGVGTLVDGITSERAARPRPHQPVPRPDGHPEHGRGPDRDQLRHDRPELHDGVGVCHRRPRDRRVLGDDPPRRRGRDDRGRGRGRHLRADGRRVRLHARAVDAQR